MATGHHRDHRRSRDHALLAVWIKASRWQIATRLLSEEAGFKKEREKERKKKRVTFIKHLVFLKEEKEKIS